LFSLVQKRAALAVLAGASLYFLYFFGLTRTGLIGPDEPRYAAIGRDMAQTGDWVTPRLWGEAWFEKPALLYWMTAAGFKAGLDPDLAPRLPVALASVCFLIYFVASLRHEFGDRTALYAATILSTCAGWLAYSHVAVTDLPMSAALAAALLTVMQGRRPILAGALLGSAVLAKGLVPLALFLPAVWYWRTRRRDLVVLSASALIVAAPWYVLVTLRNGAPFLQDFFWKHHFERFLTGALQHERPFWFYVPVLIAGFFPWSPLLLLLFERRIYKDARLTFLLSWLVWGFVFFSVSRNKLPGYLLPLMPAAAALVGIALAQTQARAAKLISLLGLSAALLSLIPVIEGLLPQALLFGLSHAQFQFSAAGWMVAALVVAGWCAFLEARGRREWAVAVIALLTMVSVARVVWIDYPVLDRIVSARSYLVSRANSITCVPKENRSWRYGLSYYVGRNLRDCQ
jgi:4-amino-4-deoxy-L-arabinose transferase-like glycosyltransferase